jgi:Uma2 family endonuclease
MTPEEYLEFERAAEFRHEYYDCVVYAMSGASLPHVIITGNLGRALGNQLESRPCIVASTDLRIRVSPGGLYTYPDVVVVCGEPKLADSHKDILVNPTVIAEILSPSTEAYDRGLKFHQYRAIESLQEYALVSQSEARVEILRRRPGRDWLLSESYGMDATCRFESIDCEVALSAIYFKVDFNASRAKPTPPDPDVPR